MSGKVLCKPSVSFAVSSALEIDQKVWATHWVAQAIAKDRLKTLRDGGSTISDIVALQKRYMHHRKEQKVKDL